MAHELMADPHIVRPPCDNSPSK